MAVDKLVDSTQLDTDLTSVANAIRAKSGGSSQLAFPAGFVSEIGNIPSGGGPETPLNSVIRMLYIGEGTNGYPAEDIDAYVPHLQNLTVEIITSPATIKLYGFSSLSGFSINTNTNVGTPKDYLKKLDLDGADVNIGSSTFRGKARLKEFNAKITVTNATNFMQRMDALEEARFKENNTGVSFSITGAPLLSNASLISVANGLKDSFAGTLTATSNQKTAMAAIMGTVADGVFTADASGTVSLQDFITSTKGWTLA